MFTFKRPEKLSFPQVYSKFQAKDRNSDEIVNYYIQDLPEDRFEEAVDLMIKHFLPDETLCSAIGVFKNPKAVEEMRRFWREMAEEKFSLVCFREGHDDIVAANFIIIRSKDDPKDGLKFNSEIVTKVFELMEIESQNRTSMKGIKCHVT